MGNYYEQDFVIDSRAVDMTGCARPSALLGYMQEAATEAAIRLHASTPEVIAKYHSIWMVVRSWFRLERPLYWNETITVRTWHRGPRGASSYRDFDLLQNGQLLGEAVTLWVLVDPDSGKLMAMSGLEEFHGNDGGELCKAKMLHNLRLPLLTGLESRSLGYSDTDINGHVNNGRYADFVCDALHMERRLPGHFVRELQIGYLGQCRAGETLSIETGQSEGILYARGNGPLGDVRFNCAVTLEERA